MYCIALFALLGLAAAAPINPKRCNYLLENDPWAISDFTAFTATQGGISYISFHFTDTNNGLELKTTCSRHLPKGSDESIEDPDNYYKCHNDDVQFMYSGDKLTISRSITDPCLGEYPYDSTTAYGNAGTTLVHKTIKTGKVATQAELEVYITEEAG